MECLINFWYDFKYSVLDRLFGFLGYMPIVEEPDSDGLVVFDEKNPQWVTIKKIIVPSEFDKSQLILAFKYLHDNRLIDTDLMAINTIVHLYECPEIIVVDNHKY